MDLDSPDWDRSPSIIEEAKDDPYITPDLKREGIKHEDVKQEDTSPTAPPISKPLASTTRLSPPPPKTPPALPHPIATSPRAMHPHNNLTT